MYSPQIVSFVLLAAFLKLGFAQENYYCANVGVTVGGSVPSTTQGYFSMKIGEGYAKYSFQVDLSAIDTDTCDFTSFPTVAYHIHTYSITNPSATPVNGCGNTAGHYDPTLACSDKSQANGGYCTSLSRTSAAGYVYTCSAPAGGLTEYTTPTGGCEIGDLSGKLGKVAVTSGMAIASTQVYTDFQPAFTYNYNTATKNVTTGWASIVFHCGNSAGTRIACGDFQLTALADATNIACDFSGAAWVNNESCPANPDSNGDDDDGTSLPTSAFAGIIAVLVIGWVAALSLGAWILLCGGAKAPMTNSSSV